MMPLTLGVCSWSLRPNHPAEIKSRLLETRAASVQLALSPLADEAWSLPDTLISLREAGVEIASGMIAMRGEDYSSLDSIRRTGGVRSDALWTENLEHARRAAALAGTLHLPLVTLHAGFLPESAKDPLREVMLDRIRTIAELFARHDCRIGLETGQETTDTLLEVLDELRDHRVGANFDPANMILYGMGEPVAALTSLLPHVLQLHIKDAVPTETPGTWGREVVVGSGAVDWIGVRRVLNQSQQPLPLMIEREAGHQRVPEVRSTLAYVRALFETGSAA